MRHRGRTLGVVGAVVLSLGGGLAGGAPAGNRAGTLGPDAGYKLTPTRVSVNVYGGLTHGPLGEMSDQRRGPKAGARVVYSEIACDSAAKTTCTPGDGVIQTPEPSDYAGIARQAWVARLEQCFRVERTTASTAQRKQAVAAIAKHQFPRALSLAPVPVPGKNKGRQTFVGVWLRATREIDETRATGCENPPPGMGCDPVAMPTGRKVKMTRNFFGARGPGSYGLGAGGMMPPPLFPSDPLYASWIVIFRANGDKIPELLLTGGAYNAAEFAAYTKRVTPWLAHNPGPALRAALLGNLAIAAFASGDRKAGTWLLAKLEIHAKQGGFDAKALRLVDTLFHLKLLASGRRSAVDPCAAPGAAP